jgi:hypothetical protein
MAEITYQLNGELPENIPGFEQYQDKDTNLIESFQINNLFDPTKNFSELHILDLGDSLLSSKYYYTGYKLSLNAQSAGREGASVLTIDPIQDALSSGYSFGGIKLLYHFLNDLYTPDNTTLDFYIDSISPDRTELQLLTNKLTAEDVVSYTESVKTNLKSQSYFSEFRLNFKNNNLLIGVNLDNLDTVNGKAVVVKLYEPLPENFDIKSTLSLVEIISDSVAYEIDYQETLDQPVFPTLRSANFNLDLQDENVIPTQYLNYDDLLSYKTGNTNSEIYSMINEKGVELSIDYSDYSNFIHFSSAQERLLNFKYKLDLLASYSQSLATKGSATGGTQGVSGSVAYYEGLYQGLINNFDHYERFLYYESGSTSWPKTNSTKPYINQASSLATTWYNSALTAAVAYDSTNYNSLAETIPTYLRDDPTNDNYLTFIYMVGQHFDNLWVYGDAVTDKYDNDNRLNYGISKDLVGEALKNFGVKLYTSNKSVSDLFSTLIGQAYQSGSEVINSYITGSLTGSNTPIQPTSFDNYQKEIQKRIYHNLPLLLKSKGTERGLRTLINCFGIPGDILDIKLYGGRNTTNVPNLGDSQYYTSSLDKIRLDNTGMVVSGSTLSNYTSIIKRDDRYTDDIHVIEVGFSPTDAVDNYIIQSGSLLITTGNFTTDFINRVLADGGTVESAQALLDTIRELESIGLPSISADASFNYSIDQFLGDPGNLYGDSYSGLDIWNKYITQNLSRYNVQDYVRLIKFFDNTIFKMVKDFIPARSVADTGIIIKPHILNISKAKSVRVSGSRPEYTASIDTAFITAGNGKSFRSGSKEYTTSYVDAIQTSEGFRYTTLLHNQEQPKYNGELSGSQITVTEGNLTKQNPYTENISGDFTFDLVFVSASVEICLLKSIPNYPQYITSPTKVYNANDFFNFSSGCTFKLNSIPITFPHIFGNDNLSQYSNVVLTATDFSKNNLCTAAVSLTYGVCNINLTTVVPATVIPNRPQPYDITTWFDIGPSSPGSILYTTTINNVTTTINNPTTHVFTQTQYTVVTVTATDTRLATLCSTSAVVTVFSSNLGINTGGGTVTVLSITAVNDNGALVDGATGGTSLYNVLTNDIFNGAPATPDKVSTTFITSTNSGIKLSGRDVVVEAGTPAGNYALTYRICELATPNNCSIAVVTVPVFVSTVVDPGDPGSGGVSNIDAINDTGTRINGATGGTSFTNILANDTIDGLPVTPAEVAITYTSPNPGVTLSGTNVVVAPGTSPGDYILTYRICQVSNPSNCDTATVTVPVFVNGISAISDTGTPVDGATGGTSFFNILANDTINGLSVIPEEVNITVMSSTNAGVTLSGTNVVVAPGTPAGTYYLTYRICEVISPSNCSTAVVTVPVTTNIVIPVEPVVTTSSGTAGGKQGWEFMYSYEGEWVASDDGGGKQFWQRGTTSYIGVSRRGIPGYFTPFNDPVYSVGVGPQTRYTAISLHNNDPINGAWSVGVYYDEETGDQTFEEYIPQDYSPYSTSAAMITSTYAPTMAENPPYRPGIPPYPILYLAPEINPYPQQWWYPETMLAVIIRTYVAGYPDQFAQVIVYGTRNLVGNYRTTKGRMIGNGDLEKPHFVTLWLLRGWRYGTNVDLGQQGLPVGQTSIYAKGTDAGEWFEVKWRFYPEANLSLEDNLKKYVYPQYP